MINIDKPQLNLDEKYMIICDIISEKILGDDRVWELLDFDDLIELTYTNLYSVKDEPKLIINKIKYLEKISKELSTAKNEDIDIDSLSENLKNYIYSPKKRKNVEEYKINYITKLKINE